MLSQKQALETAQMIYNEFRAPEQRRLNRIDEAIQPKVDEDGMPVSRLELPDDAPEILHRLAVEAETNYLPLLLDTYAQVMVVDGYLTKNDAGADDPWDTWIRNRMNSRQVPLHRSALAYGTAYASVVPGRTDDAKDVAAVRLYTPRNMTALYRDNEWDDWPEWALGVSDQHWSLIGPDEVHTFGVENYSARSGLPLPLTVGPRLSLGSGNLQYIEGYEHDLQVTPVVRYRDRHYLPDERMLGIVEPLLTVQRRIDRTSANQMVAQQIAIFRQKYIVGWVPENEEEELKASLAKVHYLDMDPSEVELGEWEATQIEPYIAGGNQARRDFSALGQIPAQSMGIDGISNISDATLAGLEASKNRRAGTITTCLGESHEQLLRLFATISGNRAAATDFQSELLWRDFESRSFAQTVDGLVKLVTGVGLPPEIALEDVPGMTGAKLERVKKALARERTRKMMAGAPPVAPLGTEQATAPAPGVNPAPTAPAPAQTGEVSGN